MFNPVRDPGIFASRCFILNGIRVALMPPIVSEVKPIPIGEVDFVEDLLGDAFKKDESVTRFNPNSLFSQILGNGFKLCQRRS